MRARVNSLKLKHLQSVREQSAAREVDVSSLANRCVQLEASNAALLSENERLREQLQQSTERSAKMRKRYEREQQLLRDKLGALEDSAAGLERTWAARLVDAEAAAAARLAEAQAELAELKAQQEEALAALRSECAARLQDVDDWCRGEVEAVQHVARGQVAQAHEEVTTWQAKYDQAVVRLEELQETNAGLQQQCSQLQEELSARSSEAASAHAALAAVRQELQEARAAWGAEAADMRASMEAQLSDKARHHAAQLALIEGRLQAVVAKKDATIAALNSELQKTYVHLIRDQMCAGE